MRNMVPGDSALLKGAVMVLMLVVSAKDMVVNQSVLGNGAPQPSKQGDGVSSTAVARQPCARWIAAPRLLKHAVSASNMGRMESASLQAAPLGCHLLKNRTATGTAEARGSCAPCQTVPLPLFARVSVTNMAAVKVHVLFPAAVTTHEAKDFV